MSKYSRLTKKLRRLEIELIHAETPKFVGPGIPLVQPDAAHVAVLKKKIEHVQLDIEDTPKPMPWYSTY